MAQVVALCIVLESVSSLVEVDVELLLEAGVENQSEESHPTAPDRWGVGFGELLTIGIKGVASEKNATLCPNMCIFACFRFSDSSCRC